MTRLQPSQPRAGDPPPPTDPSGAVAVLDGARGPAWVWGFERSGFPLTIQNLALPALGGGADEVVGTADLYRVGTGFVRRLAETPVPVSVPVGEARRLEVDLDVKAFEGEYEVRFGLARRDPAGDLEALPVRSAPVAFSIRNTIFEAFVELINSCNFKCSFCPQTTLQRPQQPIDFDLATKVVRDLADMGHHYPIRMHLLGEPLLYPRFLDFVEMTHEHGQRLLLATNGSQFAQETVDGIFRTGLDEMVISLNTPEEELYNQQRGTTVPYSEYLAGIERMVTGVIRNGPPPATRINILYDYTRAVQGDELERVRRIADEWIDVVRRVSGESLPAASEVIDLDIKGTTLMPLCEGLELQWTTYHGWGEGKPPKEHFCSFPWRQLAVLVDGQATACCVDGEGEISLGNARERTIAEIWNGPELQRLREGFLRQRAVTARCARCTYRHDLAEFFPDRV